MSQETVSLLSPNSDAHVCLQAIPFQELAMQWFRKAADQGHPHASYNLAIGHLTGVKTDVLPGEAHHLIRSLIEAHIQLKASICLLLRLTYRCEQLGPLTSSFFCFPADSHTQATKARNS